MAETRIIAANELEKFRKDYFKSYQRKSGMKPFQGAGQDKVIVQFADLEDAGKELNVPVIYPIKNSGTGSGTLSGNEAGIRNNSMRIRPVWRRNAVKVKKSEQKKASIDLYKAQRDSLRDWSAIYDYKYRLLDAFSVVAYDEARFDEENAVETWVPYADATSTQRNAFITANADRVYFGSGSGSGELVSGNFASSLANVGGSGDRLSRATIDNLKALAMSESRTDELVNPLRPMAFGEDGVERFVMFTPTVSFNHFKADMESANLNGRPRSLDNIVFSGGAQEYNGVLVIEVPELASQIAAMATAGASSAPVAPSYFCGAQALAVGWGQMPKFTKDANDDYEFINNVGIEECRGIAKIMFSGRQHGMVSVFTSGN